MFDIAMYALGIYVANIIMAYFVIRKSTDFIYFLLRPILTVNYIEHPEQITHEFI